MKGEKGLTIVEVIAAGVVLVIGAMGMATVISDVLILTTSTNDTTLAVQAARSKMDELWSQAALDFPSLYVRFNLDTTDDPAAGTSPGNFFAVPGLDKPSGADAVGEITFFLVEADAVLELGLKNDEGKNDPDGNTWDGAIDIDRNGEFNETDLKVTDPWIPAPPSHQIAPVRIHIEWIRPMDGETRDYTLESIIYPK